MSDGGSVQLASMKWSIERQRWRPMSQYEMIHELPTTSSKSSTNLDGKATNKDSPPSTSSMTSLEAVATPLSLSLSSNESKSISAIASTATSTRSLRLVTWNIDKNDDTITSRSVHIFDVLSQCNADIICLQEATLTFLRLLIKQIWLRSYVISDANGESLAGDGHGHDYGELILVKQSIITTHHCDFTLYK
jgi:hypothetical protein